MDTILTPPTAHDRAATPERIVWGATSDTRTLPETVRAIFTRLVEKVGNAQFSAQFLALQPEHLIAYAEVNETLLDPDIPTA